MNRKKKTSPKVRPAAIEDLAHNLGLPEMVVERWLAGVDGEVVLMSDHRGRVSVAEDLIEKLSAHKEYEKELKKALIREKKKTEHLNMPLESDELKRQRLEAIDIYEDYIKDLAELHRKYLDISNKHPFESAPVAAYLLMSRAISLLDQASFCLKHGYWYSGSILREIDEVVDVAHYFIVAEGTEEGDRSLHRWFRQNKAPKHDTCRRAIAKWDANLNPEIVESDHELLLNELYQKKSKWVHPTFSAIREVSTFDVSDKVNIEATVCGTCNNEDKLEELVDFFRSSIWTCYQKFMVCFIHRMPLSQEDVNLLLSYDKIFSRWG